MAWVAPKTRWTAQDVITNQDWITLEENARTESQEDSDHLLDFASHYRSFDLTVEYNHPHRYPSKITLVRENNTTTYEISWDGNMLASINATGVEGPYTMRVAKSGNTIDVMVDVVPKLAMLVNPAKPPWIPPQTMWQPGDVPKVDDYNRLESNQASLAKTITDHHADLFGHNPSRNLNFWNNDDGTVNSVSASQTYGGQSIVPKYTNGRISSITRSSARTWMQDTIEYDAQGRVSAIRRRVSSRV